MMSNLAVTVYTKGRSCQQCTATTRHLDRLNLPYVEVPIDPTDAEMMASFDELGHSSAPVVCATTPEGEQHWSGYRPDRIKALEAFHKGAD